MSSKVVEVNKPVGKQLPLQEACPHTNDTSAIISLASLVPLPSGFTISRPLWEHSDNEQLSFLLDMSSPTAYDHKPLNLVQKALDIAPPHSKRSEEQVTATAISSTEQLVEPCTQKTGSLLGIEQTIQICQIVTILSHWDLLKPNHIAIQNSTSHPHCQMIFLAIFLENAIMPNCFSNLFSRSLFNSRHVSYGLATPMPTVKTLLALIS